LKLEMREEQNPKESKLRKSKNPQEEERLEH